MDHNSFNYVKKEADKFKSDYDFYKRNPSKQRDPSMFKRLMLLLGFIAPCVIFSGNLTELHSWSLIPQETQYRWECPGCGYINYECINRCPLCATDKPEGW